MGSHIAVAGILVNWELSLLNVWAKCFLSKVIIEKLLLESIKSLMCRVLDIQISPHSYNSAVYSLSLKTVHITQ